MKAWHQKEKLERDFPVWIHVGEAEDFPPHWHEEIEIIYVISGKLQTGVGNDVYTLKKGDIHIVNSGEVHYTIPDIKNRSIIAIIEIGLAFFGCLSDDIYSKAFMCPVISSTGNQCINPKKDIYTVLESNILSVIREYKEKQKGYQMAIKARLYDLLVFMLRNIPMENRPHTGKYRRVNRLERLEKVFQYVEDNYHQDIRLDDIANAINYSVFHFVRFFKETTGMTFKEYLNNFRLRKAIWYLMNTDYPITEIALESGFKSIKTFNRLFRMQKGMSPTEYKKQFLRSE